MTRYRRLVTALALAGAATNVLGTAHASPFVGMYRGFDVDISSRGTDGAHYDVSLTATQTVASSAPEQNLYITITRCTATNKCKVIQHSKQALKDGEIVISPDMSKATLHTTVLGVRLDADASMTYFVPASLTVTRPGFDIYGLETLSGGPNPRADIYVDSVSTVRFGAVSCSGARADTYTFQGLDQTGNDVRDPRAAVKTLPAALVSGRARPCS